MGILYRVLQSAMLVYTRTLVLGSSFDASFIKWTPSSLGSIVYLGLEWE